MLPSRPMSAAKEVIACELGHIMPRSRRIIDVHGFVLLPCIYTVQRNKLVRMGSKINYDVYGDSRNFRQVESVPSHSNTPPWLTRGCSLVIFITNPWDNSIAHYGYNSYF